MSTPRPNRFVIVTRQPRSGEQLGLFSEAVWICIEKFGFPDYEIVDFASYRSRADDYCGLADEPPRAPPQDTSPALGELQYESDLEFVQEPGPAEPVWSSV